MIQRTPKEQESESQLSLYYKTFHTWW